jgi:hypothetical protein
MAVSLLDDLLTERERGNNVNSLVDRSKYSCKLPFGQSEIFRDNIVTESVIPMIQT